MGWAYIKSGGGAKSGVSCYIISGWTVLISLFSHRISSPSGFGWSGIFFCVYGSVRHGVWLSWAFSFYSQGFVR
ncbi:hypothetical protein HOY80DRAFT_961817 [Tuber brumale]|nr:hypothetical protein HOY80DRAFT_961817 [Tuber brumale]